jgi:hypothetical protein
MPTLDWIGLALFMGAVLLSALYGLAASGHFPEEYRPDKLKRGWGALLLWFTMAATALTGLAALAYAWRELPWHAAVIGGGAVLLFAPLILQPFPDTFVNGRRGLLAFSVGAALLAAGAWWRAVSP